MTMPRTPFTLLIAAAALLGFTATARANEELRVNVPVPFLVEGRLLPAGQYDIRSDSQDPSILMIEGLNGTPGHAIVNTIPEYGRQRSGDQAALTLVREGDQYRLTKVWESSDYARDVIGR